MFALLHGAQAFSYLLWAPEADVAVWIILYVVAFGLLWHRHRLRWSLWLLRHQPLLCAVLAIATASWLWSIAPEFTWHRSLFLLGTSLIGVYIGYRFTPRALMTILLHVFVILVGGGAVLALLLPEYGQEVHQNAPVWIGLTSNRNTFGFIAAIAAVLFLIGTLFGRISLKLGIGLTLLAVLALAMTKSATATVVLVVGVLSVAIFMLSKRIGAPSILTLVLVLAAGAGTALFIGTTDYVYDFTEALGRSSTFTGRTEIWAAAWKATLDRPWLGWGYGTLWSTSEDSLFVQKQILRLGPTVAHAHNGFLTMSSELGIPAGLAAIGYLLATMLQVVRAYIRRASPFVLFAMALMFMVLVETIAEAILFERRTLFWILIVAIAIAAQRVLETQRWPRTRQTRETRPSDPRQPSAHDPAAVSDGR